jgi:predicted nucleotidyltransferase
MLKESFDKLVNVLTKEVKRYYGNRLISIALFGSVARETYRADSDIDILLIANRLPKGRTRRVAEFMKIEKRLENILSSLQKQGLFIELSPIIKSPEEAEAGSPLFLDMVEDAKILYDRNAFFVSIMERLKAKLRALGAKRLWKGNAWYWDLKPDYKPGDVIEL